MPPQEGLILQGAGRDVLRGEIVDSWKEKGHALDSLFPCSVASIHHLWTSFTPTFAPGSEELGDAPAPTWDAQRMRTWPRPILSTNLPATVKHRSSSPISATRQVLSLPLAILRISKSLSSLSWEGGGYSLWNGDKTCIIVLIWLLGIPNEIINVKVLQGCEI